MDGMGSVLVSGTYDCRSRYWRVEWIDGGNKELITVLIIFK
jgi:hypothetical protein